MRKVVIYCHGYGSSAKTDKVDRLRVGKNVANVYAFDINIDPRISVPYLENCVENICLEPNEDVEFVFVGTSLGAWYAAVLADMFNSKAILVNPCLDPHNSLKKYGVSEEVRKWYTPMPNPSKAEVILSENDEVLDFSNVSWKLPVVLVNNESGHRFNGPEFEEFVVNKI